MLRFRLFVILLLCITDLCLLMLDAVLYYLYFIT